ncbi:MAG TPA: hypothetical protein VE999_05810 [Gemmataceae bacterium]|nr:hypothetical protein [Gemmataceae bacterium]
MSISTTIRDVFGHFQNLNLLALLHDLRQGRTARRSWASDRLLCPVAHGLPAGEQVQRLSVLGQIAELGHGCDLAARLLGADPAAVQRFVSSWDAEAFSRRWLWEQLNELWQERLADAEAVQELLQQSVVASEP